MTKLYNLLDGQNDVFSVSAETDATAINGLGGDDNIGGGLGNDTINGGLGNDTLYGGSNGADLVIGGAGNDRLTATSSMNGGQSTLQGGTGDDTYVVGAGQTFVIQENANEGTDTVRLGIRTLEQSYALAENVENLIIDNVVLSDPGGPYDGYKLPSWVSGNSLNNVMHADAGSQIGMSGEGGNDTMYGGNGADGLYGDGGHDKLLGGTGNDYLRGDNEADTTTFGNDTIDGGEGADTMMGARGNDTYYVDNAGDKVVESAGQGVDSVITTLTTYTLAANVENLTFQGLVAVNGTGNALANQIVGSMAGDVLLGMDGHDRMFGGSGFDAMYGGNGNDLVQGDGGNDLLYGDAGADTLSGGVGNDRAYGGVGNDSVDGGAGDDKVYGGAGNDILKGGDGKDLLAGGGGLDHMYGGAGADTFRFEAVTDSPYGGALDGVWDFEKGVDKIDVSAIDANQMAGMTGNQAFSFNAAMPMFIDAGTLWLQEQNGSTTVYADVNGDGGADFGIFVFGVTGLTASDFIL
ncbi:calcium-binding protein [Falsiroseomonas sp. HW251]|uniref:calcium-binding protein n=1 Tax=Falsiroseomonas sp. HW251 TaxID=3390998 RepID=UPI003D318596